MDKNNAPLGNVMVEVETKYLVGFNENSTSKKEVFLLDDFNWSEPNRPTLDITKLVKVRGDYFSDHEWHNRAITTVRLVADYESLVNGVFDDTVKYFAGFMNTHDKYKVDVEKCGEFE